MSITAIVENDTIKLPVHVPDGTRVEIVLPERSALAKGGEDSFAWIEEFVGCIKDGPEDLAAEHDHYAHGAPKRGER